MSAADLTQLLYACIILSVLLLVGTVLRAFVPFFRKVFLPASVIGGFIGLILGPGVLNWIPFDAGWVKTWGSMPGILIVPVVASVPLGMKFGGKGQGKKAFDPIKMFLVLFLAGTVQYIANLGTGMVFGESHGLYQAFGFELAGGFSGGHGTAGVIGGMFNEAGLGYWEVAQGITSTTATIGLVCGMIIGIIYINIMARKGKTALLKKPSDIPVDMAKGVQMDVSKQESLGRETTYNSSIESFTFHLAIILAGCGLAYALMNFVKANKIPYINQIPIWAYAIVVMFIVNFVIGKIGLSNLIDTKTKSRINGTLSDFAITAAIASIPLSAVLDYIVPILVMCVIGLVLTFVVVTICCKLFFDDAPVERAMAMFGCATGVFLNGLMLLKITDPDYKLPVLSDYSIGFSFTSISGFIMMPIMLGILLGENGTVNTLIMQLVLGVAAFVILLILGRLTTTKKAA